MRDALTVFVGPLPAAGSPTPCARDFHCCACGYAPIWDQGKRIERRYKKQCVRAPPFLVAYLTTRYHCLRWAPSRTKRRPTGSATSPSLTRGTSPMGTKRLTRMPSSRTAISVCVHNTAHGIRQPLQYLEPSRRKFSSVPAVPRPSHAGHSDLIRGMLSAAHESTCALAFSSPQNVAGSDGSVCCSG
jgi:hypothetical protein